MSDPTETVLMDADLDAEEYDALLERLAADAPDAEPADAAWDAVGDVVPEMTGPVCERVLELSDHGADEALVDEVTSLRASDDAEQLRARAVTALVADLQARLEDSA